MNIKLIASLAFSCAIPTASADQVILDDLIVDGSACIGFDCVNGESFGFDTIRIKENNLRIRAVDTSSTASFPSRDWQITFNDSSNGGANKFSIDDIDGGRTPFTIEAGAPSHSLYVDDGGRLGLGTNTPVVDVHIKSGNTPTLRLEQDGSSGFTPQTWDVAGNEANYFVRDATNGSTLPFRIFPGAPSNALTIEASTGDVGVGTTSPDASLHILDTAGDIVIQTTSAGNGAALYLFSQENSGTIKNTDGANFSMFGNDLFITNREQGSMTFTTAGAATPQLVLNVNGQHTMEGDLTISGQCTEVDGACAPDYVFSDDYDLLTLDEVASFVLENKHLPNVPKGALLDKKGINVQKFSYTLLAKIEELTLYTLKQQETIEHLQAQMKSLETTVY